MAINIIKHGNLVNADFKFICHRCSAEWTAGFEDLVEVKSSGETKPFACECPECDTLCIGDKVPETMKIVAYHNESR